MLAIIGDLLINVQLYTVLVLAAQYRLGVFGFLAFEELSEEVPEAITNFLSQETLGSSMVVSPLTPIGGFGTVTSIGGETPNEQDSSIPSEDSNENFNFIRFALIA